MQASPVYERLVFTLASPVSMRIPSLGQKSIGKHFVGFVFHSLDRTFIHG